VGKLSFYQTGVSGARSLGGEIYQALGISSFDFFTALQTKRSRGDEIPGGSIVSHILVPGLEKWLEKKGAKTKDLSNASR
jgi:hypothetical protein